MGAVGPKRGLNERHYKVAALLASGWDVEAVAIETGFAPATIRAIKNSPLMRVEIDRIKERILEKHATTVAEIMARDTPKNVKFLTDVRDGTYDDVDAPVLGQRVKAATVLADRQLPKKTEQTTETHHTFTIEREVGALLESTEREMGVETLALPPPAVTVDADDVTSDQSAVLEDVEAVAARLEREGRHGYGR